MSESPSTTNGTAAKTTATTRKAPAKKTAAKKATSTRKSAAIWPDLRINRSREMKKGQLLLPLFI